MSTAVLTAFEPFDGAASNPSAAVVAEVAAQWDRRERLATAVLPVAYQAAGQQLRTLLRELDPDVVIGVGLAASRTRPSLERVAVNLCDARIPDNDGAQPVDEPVLPGEPTAMLASVPVKSAWQRLQASGRDVEISMTAGTFVCNAVFFTAAVWAHEHRRRAGFVHVPAADTATSVAAVRTLLEESFDTVDDVLRPVGATD